MFRFCFLLICFLWGSAQGQSSDLRGIIRKGATLTQLGSGYRFTEGPAVNRDGDVYFTDQPNNTILIWEAKTSKIFLFTDDSGRANGLFFAKDGRLIACADMNNQLWSFSPEGRHEVLAEGYKGKKLNGPNDLWIHPRGAIFLTDPLYKRNYWTRNPNSEQDGEHVYLLAPGGSSLQRVAADLMKPNGIVGTKDGDFLYVADIGAGKTYRYRVMKNFTLSEKQLFANLGSDGMTIDLNGNVYFTGDGVTVFDKAGVKIAHIPVPKRWTANVCFGGLNRNTLFITAMDAVYKLDMNVRGVR